MNKKVVLLGLMFMMLVGIVGCSSEGASAEGDEFMEDEFAAETPASDEDINKTVTAFGIVSAKKDASVSVDFDAKVEKIFVQPGERVLKGDPLVTFDITATTNLIKSKERELEQLSQKLNQRSYSVDKLKVQLSSEKKSLANAKADLENKKVLRDSGSVSQDEINKIQYSIDEKISAIKNTELNIKSTRGDESNSKQDLRNQIVNLTENINELKDKLVKSNFVNENQVVSSFDNGVVTEVDSKEGDFVNRTNKIMTITDLGSRIVTADIAEEFVGRIKEGQTVEITCSALEGKTYSGKVSRVWASSIKKGGETIVPIEISIDNLDDQLLLNFNVDAKIDLES